VSTAFEEGWDALANGELLRVAEEAGFDLLLTADNNLGYQQDLRGRKISICRSQRKSLAARSADDPQNYRGDQQRRAGKLYCC
jgi:hypothetical protein